jgi:hypothetical protein
MWSRSRVTTVALSAALTMGMMGAVTVQPVAAAKSYQNCTRLNRVYPHGVGLPHAVDHTSGQRVTTFTRSRALYRANDGLDRDGDHIACEKL